MNAADSSSFSFLAPYGPLYLRLATVAERALAVDPSLTLVSLRQLAEAFAKHAAARAGLMDDRGNVPSTQVDLLRVLEQRNIVRDKIAECFHMLRRVGNSAVHDFVGSRQEALDALAIAFRLACWFHKTFGDVHARGAWQPPSYAPPTDPTASLRALQEDVARARTEADGYRLDADRARVLLEAEAARRGEEAALRLAAEAERGESGRPSPRPSAASWSRTTLTTSPHLSCSTGFVRLASRSPDRPTRGRGERTEGSTVAKTASAPTTAPSGLTVADRAAHAPSLDLVVAAFQADGRLTATAIAEATGLDAPAVRAAIKALVDAGQARARGTIYEWTA